jgi:hypothetical protein
MVTWLAQDRTALSQFNKWQRITVMRIIVNESPNPDIMQQWPLKARLSQDDQSLGESLGSFFTTKTGHCALRTQ